MNRKVIIATLVFISLLTSGCTRQNMEDTNIITEADARSIALEHAGLGANQITFIRSNLEYDDGYPYYDIKFLDTEQNEYDYEIDPYSGDVLDFDYDAEGR